MYPQLCSQKGSWDDPLTRQKRIRTYISLTGPPAVPEVFFIFEVSGSFYALKPDFIYYKIVSLWIDYFIISSVTD